MLQPPSIMRSSRDIKPLRRDKGLSSPHPECQSTPCKYGYILAPERNCLGNIKFAKGQNKYDNAATAL
jgi:hypothetical protein